MSKTHVDIGFLENLDSWKLKSAYFPSKLGGKPSWLTLNPLPDTNSLNCQVCQEPCSFLLQVYCPISDLKNSFHRTLFIFICKKPECCKTNKNKNMIAIRCNIPRENKFYSYEPPNYDALDVNFKSPDAKDYQSLCDLCGCLGEKLCSRCKQVHYCCKSHQIIDWKTGHKDICSVSLIGERIGNKNQLFLFNEYGINIENEIESDDEDDDYNEETINTIEKNSNQESKLFDRIKGSEKYLIKDLENMANNKEDKAFINFKKVIRNDPEQVIRYNREGSPLWITDDGQEKSECIPKCELCGGERVFEFQIMPQLISKLNLDQLKDSLDWGILAIYTCKQSCDIPFMGYTREFILKQDFITDKK